MSIEEMSTEIRSYLYTRISSPFLSHFAFVWAIINWRFLVALLVGDQAFDVRLEYINKNISLEIIKPIGVTLFWVFLWPFLNEKIVQFWEWRRLVLVNIKKKYSGDELLTVEDGNRFRTELIAQKRKYRSMLDEREQELAALQQEFSKMASVLSEEQLDDIAEDESDEELDNKSFMRPLQPSPALAKIVGPEPLPRTEVVKKLWAYIKQNNLQDPSNKRNINSDEILKDVFDGKDTVSMFDMTKLIAKHLSTPE
ncbi:SWIB/MDM2 domain-containing protein [Bdellovibrio sp. HCB117]|uniref:SWIB/MDM2 domain-containing protein n=1 Tax=Bdellovibrio sp. HCB117 TaxID=3394359 RepID=UPI0039B50753